MVSSVGAGLLAGFSGALGAVEKDFRSKEEFQRKLTLEDYAASKREALERLRGSLGKDLESIKANNARDLQAAQQKFLIEEDIPAREERARITASGRQFGATDRPTDGALVRLRDQVQLKTDLEMFDTIAAKAGFVEADLRIQKEEVRSGETTITGLLSGIGDDVISADEKSALTTLYDVTNDDHNSLQRDKVTDISQYAIPDFSVVEGNIEVTPDAEPSPRPTAQADRTPPATALKRLRELRDGTDGPAGIERIRTQFEFIFGPGSADSILGPAT